MQTIQCVLSEELLKAADLTAKRQKVNRSALIREALGDYLKRMGTIELEARDRRGYEAHPQEPKEIKLWEDVAAWPED